MKRWIVGGWLLLFAALSSGASAEAGDWWDRGSARGHGCPDQNWGMRDGQLRQDGGYLSPQRTSPQPNFLPRGRAYYGNRYFGNFNNRFYGPQYGYF